jgi:hypothetical protein
MQNAMYWSCGTCGRGGGEKRWTQEFLRRILRKINNFEGLGVNGKITFKWMFKKVGGCGLD